MSPEIPNHKTGTIGELLVKIRLNELGINTGNVDKDTGTDLIMFNSENKNILTGQIKTSRNQWRNKNGHDVDVIFIVKLHWNDSCLDLNAKSIRWKFLSEDNDKYRYLDSSTIHEMFSLPNTRAK